MNARKLILFLLCSAFAGPAFSGVGSGPSSFNYEGRLYDQNGNPSQDSVSFKIQILAPADDCVLYEESFAAKDLSLTKGLFSIELGKGAAAIQYSPSLSGALRNDLGAHSLASCNYTLNNGDGRRVKILVNDGSAVDSELSPTLTIGAAAYAMSANDLQGKTATDFVQINDGANVSQTKLEALLTGSGYLTLADLAAGKFIPSSTTSGAALPAISGSPSSPQAGSIWYDTSTGLMKYKDGSAIQTLRTGTSTLTEADIPTLVTSGKVSGSAITSGTIGGSTAIATTGNLQTSGTITANRLYLYDNAGSTPGSIGLLSPAVANSYTLTLPAAQAGPGQILTNDGTGHLYWSSPLNAVSSTAALSTGRIWIGDASGKAQEAAISGDASLTTTGSLTLNTVPLAKGGTGLTSSGSAGQLLTMNTTGTSLEYASITGSGGISINRSPGSLVISGATGSVTSVNVNVPAYMSATGGPITTNGTIALDFAAQSAGLVFAAPAAAMGAPGFRPLAITDVRSSVSGPFLATGACGSGQTLQYSSVSDNLICTTLAVSSSQVTTALGFTPVNRAGDTMSGSLTLPTNGLRVGSSDLIVSGGNVGVGLSAPSTRLDISGSLKVADGGESCTSVGAGGMLRYLAGNLQYCNGSSWQIIGMAGNYVTSLNGDVISSGYSSGILTTSIAANAVTDSKINDVNVAKITSSPGKYLTYAPNGATCTSGQTLKWNSVNSRWECGIDNGITTETDPTVAAFAKNAPAADFTTPSGILTLANVSVSKGGTGLNALPANGQLLIGNGSGYSLASLTAGSGVTIANSAGGVTIAATGSGGTVTNVTSVNTDIAVANGTSTPTLTANTGTGASQLLKLNASAQLPAVDASLLTNLTSSNLSSAVPVAKGGTGVSSLNSHGVLLGQGTGLVTSSIGGPGTIHQGMGTTADPAWTASPVFGVNATSIGTIGLANPSASGATTTIKPNLSTLNAYSFTLPANGGTNGYILQTDGSGTTSWVAQAGSGTVNTGSTNQLAYYNTNGTAVSGLNSLGNAVLLTNASGAPSWSVVTNDAFSQYALLAGRPGGQSLKGGMSAGESLTLDSTASATKGQILLNPSGGNVGIGTATAAATLQINGTIGATLKIVDGNQASGKILTSDANGMASWTSGVALSSLNPAAANNTIDNTNFAQTWNWSTANAQTPLTLTANALTTGSLLTLATSSAGLNSTSGLLNIANTGPSTNGMIARIRSNGNSGSGLTMLANGAIGIGTTNPVNQLDVVGGTLNGGIVKFSTTGSSTNDFAGLRLTSGASTVSGGQLYINGDGGNTLNLQNTENGPLKFWTGNAVRTMIDNAGNVGIGTVSPSSLLHTVDTSPKTASYVGILHTVANTNTTNSIQKVGMQIDSVGNWTGGTSTNTGLLVNVSGASGPNNNFAAIFNGGRVGIGTSSPTTSLDVVGDINASGNVKSNGFALTSDIRFKQNIEPLTDSLSKILNLHGVTYDWRQSEFPDRHFNDRHQVGVIAQQVEIEYPELVSTDPLGYKAVNYSALVAPIIEAIRELFNKFVDQQARIDKLEASVKALTDLACTKDPSAPICGCQSTSCHPAR